MKFGKWFEKPTGKDDEKDDVQKDAGVGGGENKESQESKARMTKEKENFTRYGKEFSEEIRISVEKRSAKMMGEARTLDELREIIVKEKITLEGSKRKFGSTDLVGIIDDIRAGKMLIRAATRVAGFREIVKKLAEKEGVKIIEREQDSERE